MSSDLPAVQDLRASIRRAARESAYQVVVGAIAPFFLFYQFRERVSLTAAIVVATAWSIGVIIYTKRTRGRFDFLTALALISLFAQAAIGIASQDAQLYLALPAIEQCLIVAGLLGSILIKRPLFGLLAQQFTGVNVSVARSPLWLHAFSVVTFVWAVGTVVRIAMRLSLLYSLGVDLYLIVFPACSWTLTAALFAFTFWYPNRVFKRQFAGAVAR